MTRVLSNALLEKTYSNSASNVSWFLPVIMYSDTNQNKSSNIPWDGSKEESNYKPLPNSGTSVPQSSMSSEMKCKMINVQRNLQKPTHAKATTWKTPHSYRPPFNNRNITYRTQNRKIS
jgi:hypothetical protein